MPALGACRTGARLCVLGAMAAGQADAVEPFISTIAITDQAAPAVPGAVFFSFDAPTIARNGTIVFSARLAQDGQDIGSSVWAVVGGAPRLELREGDPVFHGSDSIQISSLALPTLNQAGDIIVLAGLGDTGGWSVTTPFDVAPGVTAGASIAAEGFAIPGFWSGDPLAGLYPPMLNQAGHVAFMGHRRQGMWSTRSGELLLIRKSGDHAWGSNQGHFIWFERPAQNATGDIGFRALVTNPTGQSPERIGVWTNESDRRRRIAIEDMAVAGDGLEGTFFRDFSAEPRINDTGRVAFACRIRGAVSASNDSGIWSEHGGALRAVVREGQIGTGTASLFTRFHPEFAFNAGGDIAFIAALNSEAYRNSGVFRATADGAVELVTRENHLLPGAVGNVRFKVFEPPVMNGSGQVAFAAQLFGTEVTSGTNQALVIADSALNLRTIVRTGDLIVVGTDGSDMREVDWIDFSGIEPGDGRTPLDESGTVVFRLVFTDGSSGIFVSRASCPADVATQGVPEGDPGYDVPDGVVSYADLNLFLIWWAENDGRADLTTSGSVAGDPGFGVPDGFIDQDDLDYFLGFWLTQCQ